MFDESTKAVSDELIANVLFDSIGDGAITTDEFGKITRINPTAITLLGYTAKEVVGKWFPKLFTAYDENGHQVPLIERPLTRAFVSGRIISERVIYRHKSGNLVRLALTISPIMIKNKPVGCIQIFRDISAEYEIDKMKNDFISLASHQLRTPLSSVKTYTHMLLDGYMGELTDPQIKALKTVISASNRMNETVSTLLNISRIEHGSVVTKRKPLSVDKIIDAVVEEHRLAATDKEIVFKLHYPAGKYKLVSDGVVLKEVLGNLVSNAIKYTPPKGEIKLGGKIKDSQLEISVADTGLGIPLESHSKVFSKFFRADNAIRQETSGIGLGLYLVKGLMNELGGEVWFDSIEDKGSTFYLSFPLVAKDEIRDKKLPTATKVKKAAIK